MYKTGVMEISSDVRREKGGGQRSYLMPDQESSWQIKTDNFSDLPPAKRVSRLRLTFCDAPEKIKNIENRTTRSSKRNKT